MRCVQWEHGGIRRGLLSLQSQGMGNRVDNDGSCGRPGYRDTCRNPDGEYVRDFRHRLWPLVD